LGKDAVDPGEIVGSIQIDELIGSLRPARGKASDLSSGDGMPDEGCSLEL
jgi:hypothetical protein